MKTVRITILTLLLSVGMMGFSLAEEPVQPEMAVDAAGSDVVPAGNALAVPPDGLEDKAPEPSKEIRENQMPNVLTLKDIAALVMEKNQVVLSQHLDYDISRENIISERSVFEPEFVNTYQRGNDHAKYSNEDKTSILFASEKDEKSADFNASVKSKIPTGASVKAGYTLRGYKDRASSSADEQFKGYLGLEITQPLLKGAGDAISAKVNVAEKDATLAFQTLRQKRMETTINALYACWDLYAAKEKLAIRQASVNIAQTILTDNRERYKLGKIAETEILEAEAGLAKRKSQQARARQDAITALNQVKTFISVSGANETLAIDFSDHVNAARIQPEFNASMNDALAHRPEYLAAKEKIMREDLLVSYAKNQRWPQLDLTGSYGINGLGDSPGDSWSDQAGEDYHTWKVGASLTIPLLGGMKTRSELSIARHHKRQAILALKSVEVDIANRVDTSVKDVYNAMEQVDYSIRARKVYQRLLDVELMKLDAGQSNSRSVLDKEEDLNLARESEVDSFAYSKKAELNLESSRGLLLKFYEIDISEDSLAHAD